MEPLLQGRLRKRGHIIPSWRFRTFVLEYDFLRGYVLNYYVADADRDSGQAPRGSISITKSTTIRVVSAIANGFVVAREGQPEYWLAAASDSQRRQWMAVIEHARQSSMARERDDRSARPAGDTVPSAASGAGAVDAGPGRQREAHSQQFNSEAAAAVAASVGKGTITIRILRASGLSLAPRGAPFVCVACGTHIARSRVGVGVPTDPAFNETITLPFARTNLFAVVDVADEDKGGRVIGRATVPLLRASPVARRFRLPLAQPTTSSSAGAAGMLPLASALADTLDLPLHPAARAQVEVVRALALGDARSLEPGLFNVLADWPPAACETVEAAAQVLLRPFADARAGLFPGTLFLTNFRLVWVAATHSVPDPDDCGSEGDHLGSGDASDGSDAADSGDRDSDGAGSRLGGNTAASSAKRPPEAAELDRDACITKGLVGKADDSRAPLARIDEHSPDPDSVLSDAAGGSQAAFSEPTRVRAISDAAGSEASGHRRQSSAESHQRVGSGVMGAIRRVMGAGRDAHRRQESGSTVGSSSAGDDEQLPAAWLDTEDDDSGQHFETGRHRSRSSRRSSVMSHLRGIFTARHQPGPAAPDAALSEGASDDGSAGASDGGTTPRGGRGAGGGQAPRVDETTMLGSLAAGTSASFAEAQLPVLGIVTTDARAPRFIILGAGVLPEHEALGLGPSDADAAPAPVVCELLRTRLAYQIIASRSSETAFAAQSATHVSSLLREGSREAGERAGEHDEDDLDNSPLPAEPPGGAPCGVRGAKVLVSPQIRSWLRDASRASAVAWQTMAGDSIADFRRQGVPAAFWRACRLNDAFGLSRSYPRAFVVPARADDIVVRAAALFRSKGRVPALTWYHPANGAAICRSSQPLTGAMGQRSTHDEQLLEHIRRASPCPADQLAIIDCRPVLSAQANMLKGGGFESMGYSRCSVLFCNIANIHAVRKSYNALARACRRPSAAIVPSVRALQERHFQRDTARTASRHIIARGGGAPPPTGPDRLSPAAASAAHWTPEFADSVAAATTLGQPLGLSAVLDDVGKRSPFMREVSESGWLSLASNILAASVRCVRLVDALGISVLVHCSDGWDRTAQVSSLAKLLMDPYYRTLDGFQTLIATDWLQFGHKFSERMGRLHCDSEEASPIFLQWLDCVFQVYRQFPERFEFTPLLLEEVFIVSQAGWGGAFLFDNESDRAAAGMQACSVPEWAMLRASASRFRNPQYLAPPPECLGPVSRAGKDPLRRWVRGLVLVPDFSEQALRIWPFFQQFDRNVYSAIESTQGAAAPTLSMINPQTGGMLV